MLTHRIIALLVALVASLQAAFAGAPLPLHAADSTNQSAAQLSLPDILSKTVLFIYEDKNPKDTSIVVGDVLGTAFLVGFPVEGDSNRSIPIVVTAKHVIAERPSILGRYTSSSGSEPLYGRYDLNALRSAGDYWEHQGDPGVDIVAFRTPVYDNTAIEPIPLQLVASETILQEEHIGATDRVVIPCLLQRFPGTTANYPMFRDGSIALMTKEPIDFSWQLGNREIKTKQRVIFVNAAFNEGFSGAPVLLWPGLRQIPGGSILGGKPWLLGIVHGFFPQYRNVIDEEKNKVKVIKQEAGPLGLPQKKELEVFSQENPATGVAFPAWRLLEITESSGLKSRMKELIKLDKTKRLK